MTQEQFEQLSVKELKAMAKEKGLKGLSPLKKSEVIQLLLEQQKKEASKPNEKKTASDQPAMGILEVLPDGFGFIRSENYLPGENDIYVSHSQIRRFHLKTGDILVGKKRKNSNDKFSALIRINSVNGIDPEIVKKRPNFENLIPDFPNERLHLEMEQSLSMRIVDLLAPIGKGQRGMNVSPPKAGKTTLLKNIALSLQKNHPECHLII